MYALLRRVLFLLPPETAHHIALSSLKWAHPILPKANSQTITPTTVMGIEFPNKVGLAAGLDKNADYLTGLAPLGFGFIEVGTITPRPQSGNPLPRLFRLPKAEAIINRMGFNNQGVDHLIKNVEAFREKNKSLIIGINLGKNATTPIENALDDYLICMEKAYHYADYLTINISSPNTPNLRDLQYGDELQHLLAGIKQKQAELEKVHQRYVPVAVKVAPDLDEVAIKQIAEIFLAEKIDAVIATNTTLARDAVKDLPHADEKGGLSGKPVTQQSTWVIQEFYQQLGDAIPIIGVGGISSANDAQEKIKAGAKLVQIYTGFIYQGSQLIKDCVVALR
ncbi:MAG: quinone-dependent dihydroorotate dehydrogenase [bacterium]